jgi:hypothetical protein
MLTVAKDCRLYVRNVPASLPVARNGADHGFALSLLFWRSC